MSTAPKYPRYDGTWSECGTCGFWVPSRYVVLTRKHGYQCLPGSGRTRGCFDGDYDRDDIYYIYPADEGTRETTSPLTNYSSAGVAAGDSYTIYTLYDRAVPSTTYDVTFGTGTGGLVSFAASTSGNPSVGGIELNNGYTLYIQNGIMQHSKNIEIKGAVAWQGSGDLAVIGGFLQYTPYVQVSV